MKDRTAQRLSALHTRAYRLTGGRLGRRLVNNDMLLLTTKGRRTGQPRTVPLLYLRDGESLVVIASWGGREQNPLWYTNLVADNQVTVQVDGTSSERIARTASDTERAAWWPHIVKAYDGYTVYQSRTDRQIPVVFLEPI